MVTRASLRTSIRRRVGELAITFFTDAEVDDLLNEAQEDFAAEKGVIEADLGFSTVANQYEYNLPINFVTMRMVLFEEEDKLHYISPRIQHVFLSSTVDERADPEFYSQWERIIRIYPVPPDNADSTTISQVGGISAIDTSVTVVSTSGFPTSGRIKIDAEEIQYFNTTATSFLQLKRGQAGTTAATHSDGAAINELDLRIFFYKNPTEMTSDTDEPDIPPEYHRILIYYAAAMLKMKDQQFEESQALLSLWEVKKNRAVAELKNRQRDRNVRFLPGDRGRNISRIGIP